jgi:hypothetical protein
MSQPSQATVVRLLNSSKQYVHLCLHFEWPAEEIKIPSEDKTFRTSTGPIASPADPKNVLSAARLDEPLVRGPLFLA